LIFAFPVTMAWVGTAGLSAAGLVYGAHQAARVLVTASAALVLVFTTGPSDVVWATTRLLAPQRLGLAISVGVRFLPQVFERLNTVMRAAEVRGYDFSRPDKWWKIGQLWDYGRRMVRALPLLTVPVLVGSLRGCGQMALVADSRAFGVNKRRTTYRQVVWTRGHRVAVAAAALLVAGTGVVIAIGGGRF
jgi:energy-coupling factor transport system permease protein